MTAQAAEAVRRLTTEDVAVMLQVAPETVRDWRKKRTGPRFIRAGRGVRYRLADVEAWEQSRLVDPAAP